MSVPEELIKNATIETCFQLFIFVLELVVSIEFSMDIHNFQIQFMTDALKYAHIFIMLFIRDIIKM